MSFVLASGIQVHDRDGSHGGGWRILLRAVVPSLLVAVLLVACQSTGRTFRVTLQTTFNEALPVALTDQTGLVTGVTPAAVDSTIGFEPAVRGDPESGALILTWTGGACDSEAAVTFLMQEGRYVLTLATHEKAGGGCPSSGVPRGIRIATSTPVPIDAVIVTGR
ncbi:MAG: hypothetical protein HY263_02995 [Chloroflexi bacterium]|nr:hypothetical protein [Chloroflexota bacterium]